MIATVVDNWTVVDGCVTVVREFRGDTADVEASGYIETLPNYLEGRYGLDIGHCDRCGASKEADHSPECY